MTPVAEPKAFAGQPWQIDGGQLMFSIFALAILVAVIVWIYRTMQKPRLYPTIQPDNDRPTLTWQTIVRYLVTTPIMVFIWYMSILLILTWAAKGRSSEDLVVAAAAVVGAARLLAHIDEEMSRELGKTIPLAVIGVILIGRATATADEFSRTLDDFDANS